MRFDAYWSSNLCNCISAFVVVVVILVHIIYIYIYVIEWYCGADDHYIWNCARIYVYGLLCVSINFVYIWNYHWTTLWRLLWHLSQHLSSGPNWTASISIECHVNMSDITIFLEHQQSTTTKRCRRHITPQNSIVCVWIYIYIYISTFDRIRIVCHSNLVQLIFTVDYNMAVFCQNTITIPRIRSTIYNHGIRTLISYSILFFYLNYNFIYSWHSMYYQKFRSAGKFGTDHRILKKEIHICLAEIYVILMASDSSLIPIAA